MPTALTWITVSTTSRPRSSTRVWPKSTRWRVKTAPPSAAPPLKALPHRHLREPGPPWHQTLCSSFPSGKSWGTKDIQGHKRWGARTALSQDFTKQWLVLKGRALTEVPSHRRPNPRNRQSLIRCHWTKEQSGSKSQSGGHTVMSQVTGLKPSCLARVVVSVNDKWHYCHNSDVLVGSRAMRDRHLRLLGYIVLQVRV